MLIAGMTPRRGLEQVLNLALVLSSAFMFYKGLGLVANTPSPIVVVLSGSMEPAFYRGDILFLWNRQARVKLGDVVVYNIKDKAIPIVHRVLRQHTTTKRQLVLTKGDNNPIDDLELYAHKQFYLDRKADLIGSVKAYLPYVGYITILITENEYFRYAMLGLIGLSTLLQE